MEETQIRKNKENELAAQSVVLGFYQEIQRLITLKSQYQTFINQIIYENDVDDSQPVTKLEDCVLNEGQKSALNQLIFNILQLVEILKFRYLSFKKYDDIEKSKEDEIIKLITGLSESYDLSLIQLDNLLMKINNYYITDVIKGLNFSSTDLLTSVYH